LLAEYNKFDIRLYNFFKKRFSEFVKENQNFYDNHLETFENTLKIFQDKEKVLNEYKDREKFDLKEKAKKFFFKIPF